MFKMGFHVKWITIMMRCVSFVSYSIKINGRPRSHITPTRVLRQGDPFSPYIFLICVKGLSAFLKKFMEEDLLKGVATCPKGPTISRLFFADDSLFYSEPWGKITLAWKMF